MNILPDGEYFYYSSSSGSCAGSWLPGVALPVSRDMWVSPLVCIFSMAEPEIYVCEVIHTFHKISLL